MAKEIWFKRKTYGWGWTPANAKGWLTVIVFVALLVAYPVEVEWSGREFSKIAFWLITAALVAALITVCYKKGEPPRWNWGERSDEDNG